MFSQPLVSAIKRLLEGHHRAPFQPMSEKSPKALEKLAEQKKHKDEVLKLEKEHTIEVSQHPVSGNPTTIAEEEEVVAQIETAPAAQE